MLSLIHDLFCNKLLMQSKLLSIFFSKKKGDEIVGRVRKNPSEPEFVTKTLGGFKAP